MVNQQQEHNNMTNVGDTIPISQLIPNTPSVPVGGSVNISDIINNHAMATDKATAPTPTAPTLGQNIQKTIADTGKNVDDTQQEQQNISDSNMNPVVKGVAMLGKGIQVASEAAKGIWGVGGDVIGSLIPHILPLLSNAGGYLGIDPAQAAHAIADTSGKAASAVVNSPQFAQIGNKINDWATAHPTGAKALTEALKTTSSLGDLSGTIAGIDGGAKLLNEVPILGSNLNNVANDVKTMAGNAADTITNKIDAIKTPDPAETIKTNIDAVNPDLSGKKLSDAYKQVVTGGRDVTPPSLFSEQGLTPDAKTVNLGTRLSSPVTLSDGSAVDSVPLSGKPVSDLKTLGNSLNETESAITSSPEYKTSPLDKTGLNTKLDALKTTAPREMIKDPTLSNQYQNVIDFAKEQVNSAPDTIQGGREARTAFDAQAKMEFPSAFKDGSIDIKTPAGNAIKSVRDAWNTHLYDTAPNGSDLKALIGREADIFKATENIAPKAAKLNGDNWLAQFAKNNPKTAKAMKYALYTAGADKIIKGVTGLGF
jgi:hypothetical protein